MGSKEIYVQRKWRQVVIPMTIAAILAFGFILYGSAAWLFGDTQPIRSELFEFSEITLAFFFPFVVFIWLIKTFVLFAIAKQQ